MLRTATHQSGSGIVEVGEADELGDGQVGEVASVKANQMVRRSGQPATAASTSSIGATNSQAARVRCRVRRELPPDRDRSGGHRCPWRPPALAVRATSARRATAGPASSRARRGWWRIGACFSTSWTALKNSELTWLYFAPVTRDGPRHGVDEHLVERAEERHRGQHLLILVQALDRRVVGALDRAPLLLGLGGQVTDEIDRDVGVGTVARHGELPAAQRAGVPFTLRAGGQRRRPRSCP